MSLPAIRAALADILFATPPVDVVTPNGTVAIGINQALPFTPELPPEIVPCAWLGDAIFAIDMGSLEVWTHALPITVAVHEAGSAEMERGTVEAFLEAVMAQIRANQSLNGTAAVCVVIGGTEGEIRVRGKPYRGFTLDTQIVEKFEVASQIAS